MSNIEKLDYKVDYEFIHRTGRTYDFYLLRDGERVATMSATPEESKGDTMLDPTMPPITMKEADGAKIEAGRLYKKGYF